MLSTTVWSKIKYLISALLDLAVHTMQPYNSTIRPILKATEMISLLVELHLPDVVKVDSLLGFETQLMHLFSFH